METSWANIHRQVKVDKVYIETYRSGVIADDIILDDFFFNNTKTDSDIAAKGDKSILCRSRF